MRTAIVDLPSPHPFSPTLPGMYQGRSFVRRFCSALDEVLSPVLCTLDCLPAYLDVATAPDDLLPWLAAWTGMTLDPGQSRDRQRTLLRQAVTLQGIQGTPRGIELAVEAVFGLRAEVQETGAVSWSMDPDTPLPGAPDQAFVVRVHAEVGQAVDRQRLDLVVAAVKPAQVVHRVEIVTAADQGA
jgi:phage tail-like protein